MFFHGKLKLYLIAAIFILALVVGNQACSEEEEIDYNDIDLSSEEFTIYLPQPQNAVVRSALDSGEPLVKKISDYAFYFLFGLGDFKEVDLNRLKTVIVGSDPALDISSNATPPMDTIAQIRDMVEAGGTVIASGKSSAIPAILGGVNSPKFYYFSGMPRPYGNSQRVRNIIQDPVIRRHMGNAGEFMAYSVLPQKNHSLIASAGSSKILTTADYVFEDIAYDYWGPYWTVFAARVVTGIEYHRGNGKVIYINTEISENEKAGGLSKAFVDALIDPLLFVREDEEDILHVISEDNLAGKIIMNQANLNTVVYNNGIEISANEANSDVSYVFTVTERTNHSPAPDIDSSGEPELIVSLYSPSGKVYATRRVTEEPSISIAVPASDNAAGQWKYVVEEVHGIDGNRVVLAAAVTGQYNVGETHTLPLKKRSATAMYRRGMHGKIFYHQLGDHSTAIKPSSGIDTVSFGPLVKRSDVRFFRVDNDLVAEIAGTDDQVTLNEWFINNRKAASFAFFDGTHLRASEISKLATEKEPEIVYALISPDQYIVGTDSADELSYDGEADALFAGLRGDDTLIGSAKSSNIFYYRRGDGNDTIIINKGKGKTNALRFHNDIASVDVTVTRSGSDILFDVAGATITVRNGASRLDRVEFYGGTVWDARDISKLASGKALITRQMTLHIPDSARGDDHPRLNDVIDNAPDTSGKEKSGANNCNSVGIVQTLALVTFTLGMLSMKRTSR